MTRFAQLPSLELIKINMNWGPLFVCNSLGITQDAKLRWAMTFAGVSAKQQLQITDWSSWRSWENIRFLVIYQVGQCHFPATRCSGEHVWHIGGSHSVGATTWQPWHWWQSLSAVESILGLQAFVLRRAFVLVMPWCPSCAWRTTWLWSATRITMQSPHNSILLHTHSYDFE